MFNLTENDDAMIDENQVIQGATTAISAGQSTFPDADPYDPDL